MVKTVDLNRSNRFRGVLIVACFTLLAASSVALSNGEGRSRLIPEPTQASQLSPAEAVDGEASPTDDSTGGKLTVDSSKPREPWTLEPYRGMGAWVDVYDYAIRHNIDPQETVKELSRRGVKTLYLQVARYKTNSEMADVVDVIGFLDAAAAHDIDVVGWYLPGFGNHERDIQRSLNVINFKTPSGNTFDGLAIDIETREEVIVLGDPVATVRAFNAGIASFSKALRKEAPDVPLAAIVVDAKNNERAPERWLGFPWAEIGQSYDVVMPMAYWSVTRGYNTPGCLAPEYDVTSYMAEVAAKTTALMGRERPLHLIGGIADCVTTAEMKAYVDASLKLGSIGGSVYDFQTTQAHPNRDTFWSLLGNFNS